MSLAPFDGRSSNYPTASTKGASAPSVQEKSGYTFAHEIGAAREDMRKLLERVQLLGARIAGDIPRPDVDGVEAVSTGILDIAHAMAGEIRVSASAIHDELNRIEAKLP